MSVARNCRSLALAGGAVPTFTQIWQPRTPAGFAFDVGVVESLKWMVCCKRLVCSTIATGAVVGTPTGVLVVSAMVMPMACFDSAVTLGLAWITRTSARIAATNDSRDVFLA